MPITTFSSLEFFQDAGLVRNAARHGPVFITDQGRPAHVLLSIDEYRRLTNERGGIIDRLGQPPGVEDVELAVSPLPDRPRSADLS